VPRSVAKEIGSPGADTRIITVSSPGATSGRSASTGSRSQSKTKAPTGAMMTVEAVSGGPHSHKEPTAEEAAAARQRARERSGERRLGQL